MRMKRSDTGPWFRVVAARSNLMKFPNIMTDTKKQAYIRHGVGIQITMDENFHVRQHYTFRIDMKVGLAMACRYSSMQHIS